MPPQAKIAVVLLDERFLRPCARILCHMLHCDAISAGDGTVLSSILWDVCSDGNQQEVVVFSFAISATVRLMLMEHVKG
jgi:hypothetical protein